MVGLGTGILVIAALAFAQPVFAPLAFALFIVAIVWPLQRVLQRFLPKLFALLISMAATVVVLAAFGWIVSWGFGRIARYIIADAGHFQILYAQLDDWLIGHGIVIASIWAEHFNAGWLISAIQQITNRLNGLLSFTVVVLIYAILGLMEVDLVARRLRAMGTRGGAALLLVSGERTASKFRRYMMVRSLMSVATGVLVWALVALYGLPLAREWGVLAFALNYIPFIGSLVSTTLPALFAVAQFDAWENAVVLFAALQVIQFMVGSYLEPLVAGSILSMSPFLVLLSVFFWTYLWGIAGAFIGVPIVIAVLTICELHPPARWVAEMFGAPVAERG
ncbi:MAG: AI-2E family transporter [Proteobacteria bacterium]|nr:AI-2E family transporter [Pseudomonadota bacterium]